MYCVMKEITFSAAHRLADYPGLCQHLHGHNYRLQIFFAGAALDQGDMLADFKAIKEICGGWIEEHWEHVTIVAESDTGLLTYLRQSKMRHFVSKTAPTAEWMAAYFFKLVQSELVLKMGVEPSRSVRVAKVKVYETPASSAEYHE